MEFSNSMGFLSMFRWSVPCQSPFTQFVLDLSKPVSGKIALEAAIGILCPSFVFTRTAIAGLSQRDSAAMTCRWSPKSAILLIRGFTSNHIQKRAMSSSENLSHFRRRVINRHGFRDGDVWKRLNRFGRDDLPLVNVVLDEAFKWIYQNP